MIVQGSPKETGIGASIRGALFLWLLIITANLSAATGQSVTVSKVIDGDTVILDDGRHVRLIGINTPEIGKENRPDQPLARQAKQRLQTLVESGKATLILGKQSHDHHDRTLAYLEIEHKDVQADLLETGLAWLVAIPPNITRVKTYREIQAQAKKQKQGLWALPQYQPKETKNLGYLDTGFHQVRGRVQQIGRSHKYVYLNFEPRFAVRIAHKDWKTYFRNSPEFFSNQVVVVSGWISEHANGKLGMRIGHPAMIEVDQK